MGTYKAKRTNYGYKEKVSIYNKAVEYGEDASCCGASHRQRYIDMCISEQQKSDDRRIRYYRKKVAELTEIALMNTDLNTVITLTFRDSVTSYDYALAKWQLFLKRLRHLYKEPLKYICVWEYQKQRSQNEGITQGGIFHFHCLMNIGFIEHSTLEKLWGNGFVWVDSLKNGIKRLSAISYTMKYIIKEVIENADDRGKRYIFTSNNLLKPRITLISDSITKEDIIFEHLEDIIRDGEYELQDSEGKVINHVDYVEYRT